MHFQSNIMRAQYPQKSGINMIILSPFPANIELWRQITVDAMYVMTYLTTRDVNLLSKMQEYPTILPDTISSPGTIA